MKDIIKFHALRLFHKIIISRTTRYLPYLHNKLSFRTDIHIVFDRTEVILVTGSHKTAIVLKQVLKVTVINFIMIFHLALGTIAFTV